MAEPTPSLLWTIIPPVSAFSLTLGILVVPVVTTYSLAYIAAPREITAFSDAVDCSIQDNEIYDCEVAKMPRLEDKLRLGRLLREIQKQGDALREDLNRLVVEEGGTTLRISARVFWASYRKRLEERVRRLDMLRMRYLVVFMGVITTTSVGEKQKDAARSAPRDSEKVIPPPPPPPPPVPRFQQEPARRLTTPTMGHSEKTEHTHRSGWFGVVAELQRSPILRQRHASIEAAMQTPQTMSPIGSPLSALRPLRGTSIPERFQL
ncbi:hypothetical protein GGR58DRAFT_200579 [Xylaria digitata]|nr:hypothetical protein GGR58DRAFT_200579 [Xylaria digitata]